MVEYDYKTIMIVILCIFLSIVCFILGFILQDLEVTKSQCEVYYDKFDN